MLGLGGRHDTDMATCKHKTRRPTATHKKGRHVALVVEAWDKHKKRRAFDAVDGSINKR